ncbi:hypothetical protein DSM3645_19808 [Blastopirellula marina DSM 3645]|uniref:Uncharacterized protein n=2 Tax=Blastopirellula marina TaxID=124 RepID=A3ZTL1_9BACT|nr:hypothetical protein DSM3645_19808 [Blastopirellula marina DSM 3645]
MVATSNVQAAEPTNGNIDNSALSAMGLPGLEVMSDAEGEKVRGTFALAWGLGGAYVNGNPAAGQGSNYLGAGFFVAGGSGSNGASITNFVLGIPVSGTTVSSFGSSSAYGF